ncbi:NAD kinase 2, mitochondrial isoform X1 [Drosophila subobscura]|uniref:NAD kinase 2, mitochondrial isoform X1 n=1 Tax=Drosophila subobscura TaxID=7241 RepID=UPI00155A5792|nr:NAD kinase 2, mitochondrial isoform X1 [Drosophila subobscura]XP_034650425.1 NAD kinase 2, mitochondrial isoform X1 [Drosophila subobscura]
MLKSKQFLQRFSKEYAKFTPANFKLKRALVVTKLSRYEFEQLRHPGLSKEQLEQKLRDRGTDVEMVLYLHNLHKDFERRIVQSFQDVGCEVKLSSRLEFRSSLSKDVMSWADLIVPVGGDGTFLLSAGRASPLFALSQQKTPIVGFNSDPLHSEGRLMLPKHYSDNPADAVARIKSGDFKWMHRSRVRTTLLGSNGKIPESTDLFRHTEVKMEQVTTDPEMLDSHMESKYKAKMKRILPYLALNEVFIGEHISSRVSHLQLVLDHQDVVNKTKCSGLCVSTGTGSTSWHTSINRITSSDVDDLLRSLPNSSSADVLRLRENAQEIAQRYNQGLLFAPDDPRLCYSIREQICVGVWPSPKTFKERDFVKNVFVKSHCIDANLVIDGSISYPFNDGAKALLEVHPEDALLTIALD